MKLTVGKAVCFDVAPLEDAVSAHVRATLIETIRNTAVSMAHFRM